MKSRTLVRRLLAAVALVPLLLPAAASACAACFGRSDSPMAKGMNMGIFTLLVVILSVLFAISIFFFYIARRAANLAAAQAADPAGTHSSPAFSQPSP